MLEEWEFFNTEGERLRGKTVTSYNGHMIHLTARDNYREVGPQMLQ